MNNEEDFKHLISVWETLSELWEASATRYKENGNFEKAAICQARKFTFWRCAHDLRALANIHGPVPEPPPTIPGMYLEEHEAIEKTINPSGFLQRLRAWWRKDCQTTRRIWESK